MQNMNVRVCGVCARGLRGEKACLLEERLHQCVWREAIEAQISIASQSIGRQSFFFLLLFFSSGNNDTEFRRAVILRKS